MSASYIKVVRENPREGNSVQDIATEGFVLLYLKDGEVKVEGSISVKELAPIIAKAALSKLTNQ